MGRETLRQLPGGVEQRRIYDDMDRLARVSYPFSDEILLKIYRERLDAGLFPQQPSAVLNFGLGEVTLKTAIMKLVSNKSKVYPELFDPDLSGA